MTWVTTLSKSMKPLAVPGRGTKDGQVMVESSDKIWSTGEGNSLQWLMELLNDEEATSAFLPEELHEQYEKVKRYDTER